MMLTFNDMTPKRNLQKVHHVRANRGRPGRDQHQITAKDGLNLKHA
jgi:hypothetical protein